MKTEQKAARTLADAFGIGRQEFDNCREWIESLSDSDVQYFLQTA